MGAGQFSLSQNMFDKDFIAAMYGRVSCSSRPTSALANSY
jgi:hypothetical protein